MDLDFARMKTCRYVIETLGDDGIWRIFSQVPGDEEKAKEHLEKVREFARSVHIDRANERSRYRELSPQEAASLLVDRYKDVLLEYLKSRGLEELVYMVNEGLDLREEARKRRKVKCDQGI